MKNSMVLFEKLDSLLEINTFDFDANPVHGDLESTIHSLPSSYAKELRHASDPEVKNRLEKTLTAIMHDNLTNTKEKAMKLMRMFHLEKDPAVKAKLKETAINLLRRAA